MTKPAEVPPTIHVLLSHGTPIAVQLVPFVLPEYGDKVSLSQVVYMPRPALPPPWDGIIRPEDIKIELYWPEDVWRPGHIHKPEYGVRLTHTPTGISKSAHNTTSAQMNKYHAMNYLTAELERIKPK